MIEKRERTTRMHNLNMVIGVFFSEVGTNLLKQFSVHDPGVEKIRSALLVSNNWSRKISCRHWTRSAIMKAGSTAGMFLWTPFMNSSPVSGGSCSPCLETRRYANTTVSPPLYGRFFILPEELDARDHLTNLPPSDYDHLSGDING